MNNPVCLFGEVLFDCFPDGREVLGGAPFNVAWHLQALGQSPLLVSGIGEDDSGRRIRRAMEDWGMDPAGLQEDPQHPTGRVAITLEQGEPSYEILADSAYDFVRAEALPQVRPRLIYHGSLALRHPTSAAALERLKAMAEDAIWVVDVNLRAPWWQRHSVLEQLRGAHWVKLNRDELALLEAGGGDELAAAQDFRARHGLQGLVLTLGAEGAVAITEGAEPVRVRPPRVPSAVVDAVGAGDAFASVLILGLSRDWPLALTLERAQEFASELVRRRGATISDPALYQNLRQRWRDEPSA